MLMTSPFLQIKDADHLEQKIGCAGFPLSELSVGLSNEEMQIKR